MNGSSSLTVEPALDGGSVMPLLMIVGELLIDLNVFKMFKIVIF